MAGRGFGRMLMRHVIDYAANRGVHELYGDALTENHRMLDLCRHLGFQASAIGREGVIRVTLAPPAS